MSAADVARTAIRSEPLFLASASPRRRELLTMLGVPFSVVVSRFDEDSLRHVGDPVEYVRAAAEGKARDVARRRNGFILGVDTDVVAPDGSILGKPTDAEDACRMLRLLSGETHQVYTAICFILTIAGEIIEQVTRTVRTDVSFVALKESVIANYVATGEPMDKAGAYGIQGRALAFVARIDGDLSSVIGLPLPTVAVVMEQLGIRGGPNAAGAVRTDGALAQ